MVATPQDPSITARITRLEQALKNLTQKGPIDPLSFVGRPHYADGTPMRFFEVRDDAGNVRLAVWDISDADGSAVHGHQQILEYDINGNLVRSQDLHGGWAEPWFSVPMYRRFDPNGAPASYSTSGYYYASGVAQFTAGTNGCTSGLDYWEGRIPYVSHPRISVDGVWGGAATPTYTLMVNGSPVGTYTPGGTGLTVAAWGPFDISSLIRSTGVTVQILASWSGSGTVACDCLGVYLRQS